MSQKHEAPLSRVALGDSCVVTGLPNLQHDGLGHRCFTGTRLAFPESGRSWRWLLPVPAFSGLTGIASCSLYITGTLHIAIGVPFALLFRINDLHRDLYFVLMDSGSVLSLCFQKP